MMDLKNTLYWQLFQDIWNYAKKYFEVKSADWEAVISEAEKIRKKYIGTDQEEMARSIMKVMLEEIQRIQGKGEA